AKERRRLGTSGLVDAARHRGRVGHARSGTGERRAYVRLGGGPMDDPGTARIVQIALEIDILSDDATEAARQMLEEGRVAELLQWVDDAPGRTAAAALQELIVSPEAIRSVLLRDPLDQSVARALLSSLDQRASEVLLDILRDADGRTTRRLVYDRLREYGASLAPQLVRRLDGAPWYFVRNLLALLRDTASTDGETVESPVKTLFKFLNHQHEQVRVEALRLLVADNSARDAAIRHVLDDSSERVIGIAIELITSDVAPNERASLSADLGRRLLSFVQSSGRSEALVARAVRALGEVPATPTIRDALLALTSKKTWLMRRLVLTDTKPTMLAALEVLALRYGTDAQSRAVLDVGSRDRDPRVRRAALGESSRTPSAA
ncbi:MAG: hypothetical protein KA154_03860, partial [Gemmatimonadaceae bacterium]|nr:hypothetical protein [Gemmatimonadaceae bacterium]